MQKKAGVQTIARKEKQTHEVKDEEYQRGRKAQPNQTSQTRDKRKKQI
jgi:hypothetical protein